MRHLLLTVLVVGVVLFGRPAPVSAHAYLERTEPPPDAVLPVAPTTLRLWFTETLEPRFSEVVVVDATRRPVHATQAVIGPDGLSMTLNLPPLPDGAYTVTYKNVSAVDGHPARGFYSLTIGAATAPAAPAVAPSAVASPGDELPLALKATVRWLAFAGQALLIGSLLTAWLALTPALASAGLAWADPIVGAARRRRARLEIGALITTGVAALAALVLQAASAAGVPLPEAIGGPLLAVLATRYGAIWLARATLLALLAGLLLTVLQRSNPPRLATPLASGLGLALLLTTSLTSHGAALREAAIVAVAADWLHLVATALWLGGLAQLVLVAPAVAERLAPAPRTRLAAVLVGRFSALALGSVVILIATGALAAVLHLPGLDTLWTSDYGRALSTKVLLLIPMLALGALNLLGVRPALARAVSAPRAGSSLASAVTRSWQSLTRTVRGELALGLLILAAAGVLTSLAPPRAAEPIAGLRLSEPTGDLRLTVSISPARPGENTIELLATRDGRPAQAISRAVVRLTLLDQDLGEIEIPLAPAGDGRFVAQGRHLSVVGQWQAELIVRRDGQEDARTAVRFPIPATTPGAAPTGPPTLTSTGIVALAVLGLAAALVVIALRLRRPATLTGGLFGAGAAAVAVAGYLLITGGLVATGAAARPGNPVSPTAASLVHGRMLYTAQCQTCHGVTGRGDGPTAAGLVPPPIDLTQHVDLHPDTELYRMISQGVRGTAMTPFAGRLTEEERWHLVNYINTFGTAPR